MRVVGIDPGPRTSGVVVVSWPGDDISAPPMVEATSAASDMGAVSMIVRHGRADVVVCEWLTSYGAAVGATVLETAAVVGAVEAAATIGVGDRAPTVERITRPEVALELCGTRRARDSQIHEAIRQIYRDAGLATGGGSDATRGVRAQPGPLYMVRSHAWDALAVVLAWWRRQTEGQP